jgi:hypothetical protein
MEPSDRTAWFPERQATAVLTGGMFLAAALFVVLLAVDLGSVPALQVLLIGSAVALGLGAPITAAVIAGGRRAWLRGAWGGLGVFGVPVALVVAAQVDSSNAQGEMDAFDGFEFIVLAILAWFVLYPVLVSVVTRSWGATPLVPMVAGFVSVFTPLAPAYLIVVGVVHGLLQRPRPRT